MGGDHGHHGHKIVIPDYKIYKVEDAPELMRVQEVLGRQGLKDPWLRNEVWRYRPEFGGTPKQRVFTAFSRGFRFGFPLFVATIIIEKLYAMSKPADEHGHH